ncbi:MAG: DnaJ domain-containing protein, partial [Thermoanaerobaculia bacterium]
DRHPDPAQKARAEGHFKTVQEAYGVLSDPRKRRAYDAAHRVDPAPTDRAAGAPLPALLLSLGSLAIVWALDGLDRRAQRARRGARRAAWETLLGQIEDLADAVGGHQPRRRQNRRRRPPA